jgi:hypothetical protein
MYKVVKEFGFAKKGDSFNYNEETNMYEMFAEDKESENNATIKRSMAADEFTIGSLCDNGFLSEVNEPEETVEDTIKETVDFIDSLLEQYNSDLNETNRKFNNGEIQPCVKLEAETVYYNLNKVLNTIKEKLIA